MSSNNFDISTCKKIDIKTSTILDMFDSPIIECFSSDKSKKSLRVIKKYTKENLELLMKKNADEDLWLDMYFTPNGKLWEHDGVVRKKEFCKDYTWLVFDTDASAPEDAVNALVNYISDISINFTLDDVKPNLITKTYRWYHIYYKLETPIVFNNDNKEDIYSKVYKLIETKYKKSFPDIIDPATKDVSRLFRVPNSIYRKKKTKDEVTTDIFYFNQSSRLDINWLYEELKVFWAIEATKSKSKSKNRVDTKTITYKAKQEIIDDKVNTIKITEVLDKLWYKHKNNIIYQGGKPTDWWTIYPKENRIQDFSNKWSRPGWNCIEFIVMHYTGQLKKVYEFIQDQLGIDCSDILDYKAEEVTVDFDVETKTETLYEETLGTIILKPNENLITYTPPKGIESQATNFSLKIVGKVEIEGRLKILVQLVGAEHISRAMILPTDSTPAAFNKIIRAEGMFDVRINNSKFINLLNLWLVSKIKEAVKIKIVNSVRYLEDGSFVAWQYIQNNKWKILEPDPKTLLVWNNIVNFSNYDETTFNNNIRTAEESHWYDLLSGEGKYKKDLFEQLVIKELPSVYEDEVIIPLFLSLLNSIFSDFFYSNKIKMPHIIVWGETRAGKTEMITMCKRLLAFRDTGGIGTTSMTMFPFTIAGTTGVPVHLTEWVNTARFSDFVQTQAKDSYDFRDLQRGTAQQTVNTYKLRSNILFDWEELPSQDALQTRSVVCFFRKQFKKNIKNFFIHIEKLIESQSGLINYAVDMAREMFSDKDKYFKLQADSEKELLKYLLSKKLIEKKDDTDRILQNYTQLFCIYKVMTKRKEWNEYVLDCIARSMAAALKANKQFDSSVVHIKNFFTPLTACFARSPRVARGLFTLDLEDKSVEINKIMLETMNSNHKQNESFNVAVSFLAQNWFMKEDYWLITIDFKDTSQKKFKNQWRWLLRAALATDVIQSPTGTSDTQLVKDLLINL